MSKYACKFCGVVMDWDERDDVHGTMWSCEIWNCGRVFCQKCFSDKHGEESYNSMVQGHGNVMCPDCYNK